MASATCAPAPTQTLVIAPDAWEISGQPQAGPPPQLADLGAHTAGADIVIVEGFKSAPIPKIEVRRSASPTQESLAPHDAHVVAVAADFPRRSRRSAAVRSGRRRGHRRLYRRSRQVRRAGRFAARAPAAPNVADPYDEEHQPHGQPQRPVPDERTADLGLQPRLRSGHQPPGAVGGRGAAPDAVDAARSARRGTGAGTHREPLQKGKQRYASLPVTALRSSRKTKAADGLSPINAARYGA